MSQLLHLIQSLSCCTKDKSLLRSRLSPLPLDSLTESFGSLKAYCVLLQNFVGICVFISNIADRRSAFRHTVNYSIMKCLIFREWFDKSSVFTFTFASEIQVHKLPKPQEGEMPKRLQGKECQYHHSHATTTMAFTRSGINSLDAGDSLMGMRTQERPREKQSKTIQNNDRATCKYAGCNFGNSSALFSIAYPLRCIAFRGFILASCPAFRCVALLSLCCRSLLSAAELLLPSFPQISPTLQIPGHIQIYI